MLNGAYLRAWQHPAGHQLQSLVDRAGLLRSLRQPLEPDQQRTDTHLRRWAYGERSPAPV